MPKYFFDHIHLISADPLKTAEFYEKNFGATKESVREMPGGRSTVVMDMTGVTILISPQRDPSSPIGLTHFGFRTDELDPAVAGLKAEGVEFSMDITEIRPGFRISFFNAPENVSVELTEGSL